MNIETLHLPVFKKTRSIKNFQHLSKKTHSLAIRTTTGIEASTNVMNDLYQAHEGDKKAMHTFMGKTLCQNVEVSVNPKIKLATFSTMSKTKICKLKGIEEHQKLVLQSKVTIIAQNRT